MPPNCLFDNSFSNDLDEFGLGFHGIQYIVTILIVLQNGKMRVRISVRSLSWNRQLIQPDIPIAPRTQGKARLSDNMVLAIGEDVVSIEDEKQIGRYYR
jgi:hypothetical protein